MTAKEYLRQLWCLDRAIDIKCKELEKLKADRGIRQMPDNEERVVGSGYPEDHIADTAIQIIEMEKRVDALRDRYINLKAKISAQIEGMKNQTYKDILICRYILMQGWPDVAISMKYTERQCYRIHGRALQEFANLYLKRCQ